MAYMYQYFLVAVGALGILTGGAILAKEESEKTIEFLYAKPVSRFYMMTSKLLAGITNLVLLAVVFYVSVLVSMKLVAEEVDMTGIFRVSAGLLLFMLFFLSIGLVLGHFVVKPLNCWWMSAT